MFDVERTVIAQANVTMDGMTAGPDGDLSWLIEHAVAPMSAYAEGIWRGASTAVMWRTNYEGYHSIIQALLWGDLVDELRLDVLPSVIGGGLRLFDEGLPRSPRQLVGAITLESGGVGLHYRRQRSA
jgi:hypothetical protein